LNKSEDKKLFSVLQMSFFVDLGKYQLKLCLGSLFGLEKSKNVLAIGTQPLVTSLDAHRGR